MTTSKKFERPLKPLQAQWDNLVLLLNEAVKDAQNFLKSCENFPQSKQDWDRSSFKYICVNSPLRSYHRMSTDCYSELMLSIQEHLLDATSSSDTSRIEYLHHLETHFLRESRIRLDRAQEYLSQLQLYCNIVQKEKADFSELQLQPHWLKNQLNSKVVSVYDIPINYRHRARTSKLFTLSEIIFNSENLHRDNAELLAFISDVTRQKTSYNPEFVKNCHRLLIEFQSQLDVLHSNRSFMVDVSCQVLEPNMYYVRYTSCIRDFEGAVKKLKSFCHRSHKFCRKKGRKFSSPDQLSSKISSSCSNNSSEQPIFSMPSDSDSNSDFFCEDKIADATGKFSLGLEIGPTPLCSSLEQVSTSLLVDSSANIQLPSGNLNSDRVVEDNIIPTHDLSSPLSTFSTEGPLSVGVVTEPICIDTIVSFEQKGNYDSSMEEKSESLFKDNLKSQLEDKSIPSSSPVSIGSSLPIPTLVDGPFSGPLKSVDYCPSSESKSSLEASGDNILGSILQNLPFGEKVGGICLPDILDRVGKSSCLYPNNFDLISLSSRSLGGNKFPHSLSFKFDKSLMLLYGKIPIFSILTGRVRDMGLGSLIFDPGLIQPNLSVFLIQGYLYACYAQPNNSFAFFDQELGCNTTISRSFMSVRLSTQGRVLEPDTFLHVRSYAKWQEDTCVRTRDEKSRTQDSCNQGIWGQFSIFDLRIKLFAQEEGQPRAGKIHYSFNKYPFDRGKNREFLSLIVSWAIGLGLKYAEWLKRRRKVYFYTRTYCRIIFWL